MKVKILRTLSMLICVSVMLSFTVFAVEPKIDPAINSSGHNDELILMAARASVFNDLPAPPAHIMQATEHQRSAAYTRTVEDGTLILLEIYPVLENAPIPEPPAEPRYVPCPDPMGHEYDTLPLQEHEKQDGKCDVYDRRFYVCKHCKDSYMSLGRTFKYAHAIH